MAISAGRLAGGGVATNIPLICKALTDSKINVLLLGTHCGWPAEKIRWLRELGVRLCLPPAAIDRLPMGGEAYMGLTWPWLLHRPYRSLLCVGPARSHFVAMRLVPRQTLKFFYEIVDAPPLGTPNARLCDRADALIATCRNVADRMKRQWPNKPCLVGTPISTSGPTPLPPKRPPLNPESELRVVYLGRIVKHKRPVELINQWSQWSTAAPIAPARLDIYGDDGGSGLLDVARAQASQSPRITVHGRYTAADLSQILDRADLVVLPSVWEGLPHVLIEAMLHGVPIVATDAGGCTELGDNNPDVFITGQDWPAFHRGLVELAARIRGGHIDAQRLHCWAEARYGYEVLARRWAQLLTQSATNLLEDPNG